MKIIVLVDGSQSDFDEMKTNIKNSNISIIDTTNCDKEHEYRWLTNAIHSFSHSNTDMMLVHFSGRNEIFRELGDESSEMILALSYDKRSRYFVEKPTETLTNILKLFKGD